MLYFDAPHTKVKLERRDLQFLSVSSYYYTFVNKNSRNSYLILCNYKVIMKLRLILTTTLLCSVLDKLLFFLDRLVWIEKVLALTKGMQILLESLGSVRTSTRTNTQLRSRWVDQWPDGWRHSFARVCASSTSTCSRSSATRTLTTCVTWMRSSCWRWVSREWTPRKSWRMSQFWSRRCKLRPQWVKAFKAIPLAITWRQKVNIFVVTSFIRGVDFTLL